MIQVKRTKEGMLEVIKELREEFRGREKWYDKDSQIIFQELRERLWELEKQIEEGTYEYL
jgi:DNA phosphorothioation-dependent restriction protein DptG